MSTQDDTAIKYIGKREPWHDRLYHSGLVFNCHQVRQVPWDIARKLLRHQDLFEAAAAKDADDAGKNDKDKTPASEDDDTQALLDEQAAKNKETQDKQQELQALYDQVNIMDKEALKDFAMDHYQQKINKSKSVENLRIEVNGMIDRFGVM